MADPITQFSNMQPSFAKIADSLDAPKTTYPLGTANLEAADKELKLTPQEKALYQRHLKNLSLGGVPNKGETSTLFQTSVEIDGKIYNIPTVWDGEILPPDRAIDRAVKEGLDKFPSYASESEAEQRYQAMHGYMEKDMLPPVSPLDK